jgi:hypothetical protein
LHDAKDTTNLVLLIDMYFRTSHAASLVLYILEAALNPWSYCINCMISLRV